MWRLVLGLQLEHLVVYDELLKCLLLLRPGEEKVVFLHALVESRDILRVDGQQLSGRLVMSVVQDHRREVGDIVKIQLLRSQRRGL